MLLFAVCDGKVVSLQAERNAQMKLIVVYTIFFLSAFASVAQTSWVGENLPWMIERRTSGIRCVRQFVPSDSVMGARKLVRTTYYDRHGYETSPSIDLRYDTLGRLTQRLERQQRNIAGVVLTDTTRIQTVRYSPEGLVSLYSDVSLRIIGGSWYSSMVDTQVTVYRLVGMNLQSGLGVTRCTYQRLHQWRPASYFGIDGREDDTQPYNTETTCICERTFDGQGRLLTEVAEDCNEGLNSYGREYIYGEDGRIAQEYRNSVDGRDTLYYQYNILGKLIGMDGVGHSADAKIDIHIRCQANGLPLEESTTWWNIGEEGDPESYPRAIIRTYYNSRGDVLRTAFPGEPVYEYDYDYWD